MMIKRFMNNKKKPNDKVKEKKSEREIFFAD
jgi:hypothetical protein